MVTVVPSLQALILCDSVFCDRDTAKFVIAGTFTRIYAPAFPAVHPPCWLYARVLGASGDSEVRFRVVDLSTNDALGESGPLRFKIVDPVVGHEIGIRLPPLGFAHAGAYSIELLWGSERRPLGDWRFELAPQPKG